MGIQLIENYESMVASTYGELLYMRQTGERGLKLAGCLADDILEGGNDRHRGKMEQF